MTDDENALREQIATVGAERDEARMQLEAWRNCFICPECGRGAVDEDWCCSTCGEDAMAFLDGKLFAPHPALAARDAAEAKEREQRAIAEVNEVAVRRERDELLVKLQSAERSLSRTVAESHAAGVERDAYRAMVADLLASAHPHPVEHPTMTKQWARARELLKNGPVQ